MNALVVIIAAQVAALPDPDRIREKAAEVVGRPEFQEAENIDLRGEFFVWLIRLIERALTPFFAFFGHLWEFSPILATVVFVLLVVLLVVIVGHIIRSFRVAMQRRTGTAHLGLIQKRPLDPRSFELEAEDAARRQDYIVAVRLLFRAALLRLELAEKRTTRPGVTNREYLRRYRGTSSYDALRQFVEVIDAKWYGGSSCDQQDYLTCRQAHATLQGGGTHAHGT